MVYPTVTCFTTGDTSVSGGNTNSVADFAGDLLNYSFTVKNLGNVTLTDLVVTDALTGMYETLASLAPGASKSHTSTYTLLQSDLDTNGGGDGRIENPATVYSNETGILADTEAASIIFFMPTHSPVSELLVSVDIHRHLLCLS